MQGTEPPKLWSREIASQALYEQSPLARREQVGAAHIRLYYELSHLGILVTLVFVVLTALAVYSRVQLSQLVLWVVAVSTVALVRFAWSWQFLHGSVPPSELPHWRRRAWLGNLAQALTWSGLLIIVTQGGHPADIYLALFVLVTLAFGSFATLSYYFPAYLTFCAAILGAVLVWFIRFVPEVSVWMAAILATAAVALIQSGVRATRVLRGALLLNSEREELISTTRAEKERIQVTLRAIGDGVISTDVEGRVAYLNACAEELTGWANEDAAGLPLERVLRLKQGPGEALRGVVKKCLVKGETVMMDGERWLLRRDGEREAAVQIKVSPILDASQAVIGAVVVLRDVTELAGLTEAISYQAQHDSLTGLLNRNAFGRAVAEAMEYSRRHGVAHAVCYFDLDQFKIVNDTCGHSAGDELLKQLAERLRERMRDGDVLARLGGDEFGVLLFRCGPAKAQAIAEEFCALVREFRFVWGNEVFTVGASIGLVPFDGNSTPQEVLAAADAACFIAKEQGRNRVHIAHPGDSAVASRHGEMRQTTLIQRALDEDRFRLRYQRIEPLRAGAGPVKVEFLVSMLSPEGELLPPAQFLPAAERFNMMPRLDRHIVRLAFQYAACPPTELADIDSFSVNLSGQSLADRDFLGYVVDLLAETGVDPRTICFEITETAVIANLDAAIRFIERLRAEGCQFALDDFGSGLSSFGYLRNLPVDYLKIDGQFVKGMCEDRINQSIVESINQIGHLMGIKTVAEFVEHDRVRDALAAMGVDYGQGWGIHRPQLLERLGRPEPVT